MKGILALLAALALPAAAGAADPAATYAKECSACHMAYPPGFLPARSWQALTSHLSAHFGEDASLDAATTASIAAYLAAQAADAGGRRSRVLRGVAPGETPLRITDMPFWRRIHSDLLAPGVGTGPGIRSAANCASCHNGAGEDD